MKKVYCLYRVSDPRQVQDNDIPMQRIACHTYAECHGWEIVREFTERGVSGYKLHMEERDAIVQIKEAALLEKFDILLVFMFDRIGRRDDETPFVVEWLVRHGVAVWSVCEGEQRFDNHVDKLTNYIRSWQAAGESERISERTRTRIRQITEEGYYTGGVCPYGYQLVHMGRTNRKGQPVYDLAIHPEEAKVVKFVFETVAYGGGTACQLAKALNERKRYPKSGKPWSPSSLYGLLRNPLYTGVLRRGRARGYQPGLQTVSQSLFDAVQAVRSQPKTVPRYSEKGALLTGLLYCGTCGSRMVSNHITRRYQRKDGSVYVRRIQRYYCTQRKDGFPCVCTGQHIYVAKAAERAFLLKAREKISALLAQSPAELAEKRYKKDAGEIDTRLAAAEARMQTATEKIRLLQTEIMACLQGQSAFSAAQIQSLLAQNERERDEAADTIRQINEEKAALSHIKWENEVLIGKYSSLWAEFESAEQSRQRAILRYFIQKIEISRGYSLEISYHPRFMELFML